MARSRRTYRRSTSQRAVSLFASVLPAPLQRIADTKLGSSLIILGIPALVVAGILQLEWNGGLPHLKIDRDRAREIRNAAREEFGRIGSPETLQTIDQWERSAVDLWKASQGNHQGGFPSQPTPSNASYPATYSQPNNGYDYRTVSQQHPLPSSSAARSVPSPAPAQGVGSTNTYPNSSGYYPQPPTQPTNYSQFQQQPYGQQPVPYPQQPANSQPPPQNYYQQPLSQQPTSGQWRH